MKYIFSCIITLILCQLPTFKAFAQNASTEEFSIVTKLDSTEGVKIEQPEALTKRLVKITVDPADAASRTENQLTRRESKPAVYRIEVFSDNTNQAKTHATARRRNMQNRFPQYPSTLEFESPFWRVKVGSFSNRSDAEAALAEIRNAFPSYAPYLRIVRN